MPPLPFARSTLPVLAAAFVALALTACSRTADMTSLGVVTATKQAAAPRGAAASAAVSAQLAITRHVRVELPDDRIAPLYADLQAACAADTADACVVLHANLGASAWPSASLSLRAAPAGIAKLLEKIHGSGRIADEGMDGEDLAAPIADGERRLAMLRQYRDSLVALRDRPGNTIDALIRINEELAQTQSQLEAVTGESAHLHLRVDTQVLDVQIAPPATERRATPVGDALSAFGHDFASAVGAAITFVAYAIPWLVLMVPVVWALRRLRARWRKARQAG